jgi:hypothetical protein
MGTMHLFLQEFQRGRAALLRLDAENLFSPRDSSRGRASGSARSKSAPAAPRSRRGAAFLEYDEEEFNELDP